MSFSVDKNTSAVTMHRGDTGAYYVTLHKKSGDPFESGDVALYKVKQGSVVKLSREYALDDDEGAGNGRFLLAFHNSDTDTWAAGTYNTEIRVALNPLRNGKVYLVVLPATRTGSATAITATINDETCLAYVTGDSGTVTLEYTTAWSENPTLYGVTVTGTPISGDAIVISWDKNGDGSVKDGDTIRTIAKSKSTITILDVLTEV